MVYPRILIIDDERNFREFLGEALEVEGFAVETAATARAGLAVARAHTPHVVLLDQNLPDRSGLELLAELRQVADNPVVIVITAFADYPQAVGAIKAGAFHYLSKPFEFQELLDTLAEACVSAPDEVEVSEPEPLAALVGAAPAMVELKRQTVRVARSPVGTVLLQGESGTGKELVARAIHLLSDRRGKRMLSINCAALTETLLMSELFGHERGAFTDARQQKKGVFETAQGGTLFLDEISEMGPRAQAALLRTLEQRTVTRVGGTEETPVDVRIVAATNRCLERQVAEGHFRGDLYHRLNVVRLQLPPLRERGDDVAMLARHFAEKLAARYGEPPRHIPPETAALLTSLPWPGNVRELRNTIERAYVVNPGPTIAPEDLPLDLWNGGAPLQSIAAASPAATAATAGFGGESFSEVKRKLLRQFERTYLETALARAGGNVTRAAEAAGLVRQVFQRLLSRHGIDPKDFRE